MTTLSAILATPPLTSGGRTLARVEMARQVLGAERSIVANLYDVPTRDIGELATKGHDPAQWRRSRTALKQAVDLADVVMLAYGVSRPPAPVRSYHDEQVEWLNELFDRRSVPVLMVGGRPRHPSRWQRWTSRAHPGRPFREALTLELWAGLETKPLLLQDVESAISQRATEPITFLNPQRP